MYRHEITVKGSGAFPVDMLRYDGCFPARTDDALRIQDQDPGADTYEVHLLTVKKRKTWEPTNERWRSFLWSVVDHKVL